MNKTKLKTLKEKLNYIQANLKVKKEKINKFGGFKYRNLEDIFEGLKPLLKETECIVTISDEIKEVNGFNYICATVTLSDYDQNIIEVNGWARESVTKKGMDDSQITGSTSSYARKYAMNGLFAIDDTADADSMDNREMHKDDNKLTTIQIRNLLDMASKTDEKTHTIIAEKIDSREINKSNYQISLKKLELMQNE